MQARTRRTKGSPVGLVVVFIVFVVLVLVTADESRGASAVADHPSTASDAHAPQAMPQGVQL